VYFNEPLNEEDVKIVEKKYKPEPKETLDSTIAKSNDAIKSTSVMTDDSGQVFYKVQLFASSKKKDLSKNEFKGLDTISYTFENNLYRYYFGKSYDLSSIKRLHNEAKSHGFLDAFIVQFDNGKVSALK
jgi:N-acetylmuramoyl-L-alanine amidase